MTNFPEIISGINPVLPEIEIVPADIPGVVRFWLPNGWGVSMARHEFSYSGDGTAELAVISRKGADGFELRYDSGFADDVIGWQTPADLIDLLIKLNTLPSALPAGTYAECGEIAPCDCTPALEGKADRNYWDDRYAELPESDSERD